MVKYPCIKQSASTGNILLFVKRGTGYVIHSTGTEYVIGEYSDEWMPGVFRHVKDTNAVLDRIKIAKEKGDWPLDIMMLLTKQEKLLREAK